VARVSGDVGAFIVFWCQLLQDFGYQKLLKSIIHGVIKREVKDDVFGNTLPHAGSRVVRIDPLRFLAGRCNSGLKTRCSSVCHIS